MKTILRFYRCHWHWFKLAGDFAFTAFMLFMIGLYIYLFS